MPADEATTSLRCASHWCWLRADHMLTVAASPLLSLSQLVSLSLLDPLLSIAVIPELYVLSLSVSSPLLTAVCALPECCLHVSSRCLLISSDPLRSQPINRRQPSRSQPHVVSLSLSVSFLNVVCPLPKLLSAHLLLLSAHIPSPLTQRTDTVH